MRDRVHIVLKSDPLAGLYAHVPSRLARQAHKQLAKQHVCFAADPGDAAHLAEPDGSILVFGTQHPSGVHRALAKCDAAVEIDPTVVLPETTYRPPLDDLLRIGAPDDEDITLDYAGLKLGRSHAPELIRMATDEALHTAPADSAIVWAPVHAWRMLGTLRAEEAIEPLLGLLRRIDEHDDDWVGREIPGILGEIGPAALKPAAAYLADPTRGEFGRIAAAETIEKIGRHFVEMRETCITCLTAQLERFAAQSESLNAFLIMYLVDFRAIEAAPLMEKVFAANAVDLDVMGDWEDVQIELGLKLFRESECAPTRLSELADKVYAGWTATVAPPEEPEGDLPLIPWDEHIARIKTGRNEPCPCGSGRKYKKCCGS